MPKKIQNIQTLNDFSTFVENSKPKVSTFGGRRCYNTNNLKKDYSMNDLVYTLQAISNTKGDLRLCKKKLAALDIEANDLFDKTIVTKNPLIRLIAKIKKFLGNLFFNRFKVFEINLKVYKEEIIVRDDCLCIKIRENVLENQWPEKLFKLITKAFSESAVNRIDTIFLTKEKTKTSKPASGLLIKLLQSIKSQYLDKKPALEVTPSEWLAWDKLKTLIKKSGVTLPKEI